MKHLKIPDTLIATLLLALAACGSDAQQSLGPDAGMEAEADADAALAPSHSITIGTCPGRIVLGEAAQLSFSVDGDHSYRLEGDGQSEGAGVLLAEGSGQADALIGVPVDSELLGLGRHELRLYARPQTGGASAVAVCTTDVISDLRVLYLNGYQTTNSAAMVQAALEADARVGSVDIETYDVINPGAPSLAELEAYDVVVFSWWFASFNTGNGFGNVFADYVDAGGGLVLLGHSMNDASLLGRLVTSEYVPLRAADPHIHSVVGSLVPLSNGHSALAGISSMSADEHTVTSVDAEAEVIAQWDDGDPLLAIKGSVVSVTARFSSLDENLLGDWEELLANSVVLAAESSMPL